MPTNAIATFIFVDFENVPNVDFNALKDERVKVTILLGEKSKLSIQQIEQITKLPFEFRIIKVGLTGKNAADFALTFHLGETVARYPNARFYILSGDQDFDPLITHLKANHVKISRHGSIAELPLLTPAPVRRKTAPPFAPPVLVPKPVAAPVVRTPNSLIKDRLSDFVDHLHRNVASRPRRKKTLLAHLNSFLGGALSEAEQEAKLKEVEKRIRLKIDAKGAVTYPA